MKERGVASILIAILVVGLIGAGIGAYAISQSGQQSGQQPEGPTEEQQSEQQPEGPTEEQQSEQQPKKYEKVAMHELYENPWSYNDDLIEVTGAYDPEGNKLKPLYFSRWPELTSFSTSESSKIILEDVNPTAEIGETITVKGQFSGDPDTVAYLDVDEIQYRGLKLIENISQTELDSIRRNLTNSVNYWEELYDNTWEKDISFEDVLMYFGKGPKITPSFKSEKADVLIVIENKNIRDVVGLEVELLESDYSHLEVLTTYSAEVLTQPEEYEPINDYPLSTFPTENPGEVTHIPKYYRGPFRLKVVTDGVWGIAVIRDKYQQLT